MEICGTNVLVFHHHRDDVWRKQDLRKLFDNHYCKVKLRTRVHTRLDSTKSLLVLCSFLFVEDGRVDDGFVRQRNNGGNFSTYDSITGHNMPWHQPNLREIAASFASCSLADGNLGQHELAPQVIPKRVNPDGVFSSFSVPSFPLGFSI